VVAEQVVSDAAVATTKDQDLNELFEDDPVGDASSVAAQRVVVVAKGEEGGELVPEGFEER
jgi:hypothetical protein